MTRTIVCPGCFGGRCGWRHGGACSSGFCSVVGVPTIGSASVRRTIETCWNPSRKCARRWNHEYSVSGSVRSRGSGCRGVSMVGPVSGGAGAEGDSGVVCTTGVVEVSGRGT